MVTYMALRNPTIMLSSVSQIKIHSAAANAGISATLMPVLICEYWRGSYISSVVRETGRGIEMRKVQQLVRKKTVLGKTCDRFKVFNVLHPSTAFGGFVVTGEICVAISLYHLEKFSLKN